MKKYTLVTMPPIGVPQVQFENLTSKEDWARRWARDLMGRLHPVYTRASLYVEEQDAPIAHYSSDVAVTEEIPK